MRSFETLPQVTSDCKPWPAGGELAVCEVCGTVQKPATEKWLAKIEEIYGRYELYYQAGGAEQPIFCADGSSAPRSQLLIDFVSQRFSKYGTRGRLIDIGCGTGAALRNFSRTLPGWTFDGAELSNKQLKNLKKIPRFDRLYTVPLSAIDQRYDVVTMIHSLEHIVDPAKAIEDARNLLKPAGTLFVQVPDVETSPFDLLVADHRSHFSRDALRMLAARSGIRVDLLENTVIVKENTLIGVRDDNAQRVAADPAAGAQIAERTIEWLQGVLSTAREASRVSNFGLFGSSISAMWLYGALRDRVVFFVDEDQSRVGGSIDGRPILAPTALPADSTVFVPLIDSVAGSVVTRLSRAGVNYVVPSNSQ